MSRIMTLKIHLKMLLKIGFESGNPSSLLKRHDTINILYKTPAKVSHKFLMLFLMRIKKCIMSMDENMVCWK